MAEPIGIHIRMTVKFEVVTDNGLIVQEGQDEFCIHTTMGTMDTKEDIMARARASVSGLRTTED